jgi:ABC-type Fe3+ transport system permease subunit
VDLKLTLLQFYQCAVSFQASIFYFYLSSSSSHSFSLLSLVLCLVTFHFEFIFRRTMSRKTFVPKKIEELTLFLVLLFIYFDFVYCRTFYFIFFRSLLTKVWSHTFPTATRDSKRSRNKKETPSVSQRATCSLLPHYFINESIRIISLCV